MENTCIACIENWVNPKTIVEIGTYLGGTTRILYLNSPEVAKIYTVDLPLDYLNTDNLTDRELILESVELAKNLNQRLFLPKSPRIHQILADSAKLDWPKEFGDKVDFIFIDGSHSFQSAKHDTEQALKLVSEDGAIIWHDAIFRSFGYYWEGYRVSEAIREILPSDQWKYVYRMAGTSFAVYWPKLEEMIIRHRFLRSLRNPERILDLGCGIGNNFIIMKDIYPQSEIHGIDIIDKSNVAEFVIYNKIDLDK